MKLYLPLAVLSIVIASAPTTPAARDRPAEIRRDTYGVPHITGPSERAVAFAHGYATAEDHGPELARLFLRARGEQASIFGEKFLTDDARIQIFGIHRIAAERMPSLPPHIRGVLDGYAAGYNQYLREHPDRMPAWAAPIAGVDVLAHCRAVLLLDFTLDLRGWRDPKPARAPAGPTAESREASVAVNPVDPVKPVDPLDRVEPVDPFDRKGSNMWAIGRGRAEGGRGLLLANPHLAWNGSQIFHEVHLKVPGAIDVYGATLIGFPVVAIGFTRDVAWSHTVNAHDSQDLYKLERDRAQPGRYRFDDGWRELTTATARVRVKSGDSVQTVEIPYLVSHYGPVFEQDPDTTIALRSASLDVVEFIETWNRMGKAKSVAEVRQALDLNGLPMFNVAIVDRAGHIANQYAGRIPRRAADVDWSGVVPGATRDTDWRGLHTMADLPHLVDPTPAYVQNCNDPPWFTNLHARLDPLRYPTYLRIGGGLGLRGQRSLQLLEGDSRISLDEVVRYKHDVHVLAADRVKADLLARAAAEAASDPSLADAVAVLRAWDDTLGADSAGAVLFVRWMEEYGKRTRQVYAEPWQEAQPLATPRGLGDQAAAVTALKTVAAAMQKEYGRLDLPWGAVHRLRTGKIDLPLAGGSGQLGVFRVLFFRRDQDGKMAAAGGDSYVLAVELGRTPVAWSVLAYSQSADPQSPHAADQAPLFAAGRMKPVSFTDAAIAAHTTRRYSPEPLDGGTHGIGRTTPR
jgi:acyl-homoserine-lactone acylase